MNKQTKQQQHWLCLHSTSLSRLKGYGLSEQVLKCTQGIVTIFHYLHSSASFIYPLYKFKIVSANTDILNCTSSAAIPNRNLVPEVTWHK